MIDGHSSRDSWPHADPHCACALSRVAFAIAAAAFFPTSLSAAPFGYLSPGFTQELFASAPVTRLTLAGIAFAPNGDVWTVDGGDGSPDAPLIRFDAHSVVNIYGSTIHPELAGSPFASNSSSGLTNHPDGYMYANIDDGTNGIARIDASTGATRARFGPRGRSEERRVGKECRL